MSHLRDILLHKGPGSEGAASMCESDIPHFSSQKDDHCSSSGYGPMPPVAMKRKRDRAGLKYRIVKSPNVEAVPESRFNFPTTLHDRHLTEVVSESLTWPRDISIHLCLDLVDGERSVVT